MGIEIVCTGCGAPIGANQFSQSVGSGYCARCNANALMQAQVDAVKRMNPNYGQAEKEVFGETLREVPLIEVEK